MVQFLRFLAFTCYWTPETDASSLTSKTDSHSAPCRFDRERLRIEDIADIAAGPRRRAICPTRRPSARAIARGADFLDRLLREDGAIYGVTTGYGDSCTVTVPPELVAELPHHLYTYHGCGLGEYFDAGADARGDWRRGWRRCARAIPASASSCWSRSRACCNTICCR